MGTLAYQNGPTTLQILHYVNPNSMTQKGKQYLWRPSRRHSPCPLRLAQYTCLLQHGDQVYRQRVAPQLDPCPYKGEQNSRIWTLSSIAIAKKVARNTKGESNYDGAMKKR